MTTRILVKPELLTWALARAQVDASELAGRFPQLGRWLAGDAQPTLKQLEGFAKATHAPLGYLFLSTPPREQLPIPDFRTIDRGARAPSPDLLDTVYAMQRRQAWLRDALVEAGAEPLAYVESARPSDDPEASGAEMRRVLGLEDGWAQTVTTWQQAVTELRRRIEQLGIMAVINGVVGNDTHRALDVTEFRGFAIADAYAPLIFVNGADAKSAQMFTLAHELAHVWLGAGGVSGFEGLFPRGSDTERWCDKAAAELLVPAIQLKAHWPDVRRETERFAKLARTFKVSPIVAARRALDLRLVGRDEFTAFYDDYTSHEHHARQPSTGGDFYNNQNTRVGELFARHVIRAALEGRLGFKRAYELTGLRGDAFQQYASRLGVAL